VGYSPKWAFRAYELTEIKTIFYLLLLHFCRNRRSRTPDCTPSALSTYSGKCLSIQDDPGVSFLNFFNFFNSQFCQFADWHARIYLYKIIIYLYIKIFCNKTRPPLKLIVPQTQPKLIKLIIDFVEKVDFLGEIWENRAKIDEKRYFFKDFYNLCTPFA
jgi:hypothetical protein